MGKQRKKVIIAGPLVYEAIYPLPNPRDSRAVRQGKKNPTSAAQQRMNQKYQWQKLELVTACNFRWLITHAHQCRAIHILKYYKHKEAQTK